METIIIKLENILMATAVLCMVIIMFIVSYDAFSRYIMGAPLSWSSELVSNYLMIMVTYCALATTFRTGDHISIDLVTLLLPKSVQAYLEVLCNILAIGAFGLIAACFIEDAAAAYSKQEFFAGYIMWPVWLSYLPIAIGSAVLVLRVLRRIYILCRFGLPEETKGAHDLLLVKGGVQ